MGENKKVKLVGATLGGDMRSYEFVKIPALVGVRLVHEYGSVVLSNMDQIRSAFGAFADARSGERKPMEKMTDEERRATIKEIIQGLLPMVEIFPRVMSFSRIAALAKDLLSGGYVDGHELDSDGMCEMFGEDPLELYAAIFWALTINYPKYFGPLLEALEEGANDDTTQDSETTTETKTAK